MINSCRLRKKRVVCADGVLFFPQCGINKTA